MRHFQGSPFRNAKALVLLLLAVGTAPCSNGPEHSSASSVDNRSGNPETPTGGDDQQGAVTSADTAGLLFRATFDEARTIHEEMSRDGGGELLIGFNSHRPVNGSYAEPTTDFAHSGSHSVLLSQDGLGGTERAIRLQRWAEFESRREVFYSAWFYFPRVYHAQTGGPWGWHNFWQFPTSRPMRSYPLYILGWRNVTPDAMALNLTWWPEAGFGTEGPLEGQEGRRILESPVTIPVGEWFQVEARYVCDPGFNGSVQFWLNGQELFALDQVRTADPSSGSCYTSITSYGAHLQESRIDLYVDDFVTSSVRVGPGQR
jgi:hypothetical protein